MSAYSSKKPRHIEPEKVDLGDLPPLHKSVVKPSKETTESQPEEPNTVRSYDRTDVPSERTDGGNVRREAGSFGRRNTKRHPFEIYEDQLVSLQRLKASLVLEGKQVAMAEMVREAIDDWLAKRKTD